MRKQAALLFSVLMCLTAMARADIPVDPVRKTAPRIVEAPLVVVPGAANDTQMYIRLPSKLWRQGRADAGSQESAPWYALGSPRGSTLIAGVALTLALSFAGLWLIRGGKRRTFGGFMLILIVGLIGVSGCPPRWYDRSITFVNEPLAPPVAHGDGTLKGEALLETGDNASSIQVVVPSEQLVQFSQSQSEQ